MGPFSGILVAIVVIVIFVLQRNTKLARQRLAQPWRRLGQQRHLRQPGAGFYAPPQRQVLRPPQQPFAPSPRYQPNAAYGAQQPQPAAYQPDQRDQRDQRDQQDRLGSAEPPDRRVDREDSETSDDWDWSGSAAIGTSLFETGERAGYLAPSWLSGGFEPDRDDDRSDIAEMYVKVRRPAGKPATGSGQD